MVTTLNFTKQGDHYAASFTSQGDVIVQMMRTGAGYINVFANIEGMYAKSIASWSQYDGNANMLFRLCLPKGLIVTIESGSEVSTAKVLYEE